MKPAPLISREKVSPQKLIHLLLIEDEEAHAELVRRALQGQAMPVDLTVVRTLREAREYLNCTLPDLVITDIRLPDGNGIELLSPGISDFSFPVIVMTSYGDEKMAVEAMKAGALDYVVKSEATLNDIPHVAERTLRQWHEITGRKRAEKELRIHAKQLVVLSHLSHQVLSGIGIDALMREATHLITQTLKTIKCVKILELLPDRQTLLLRAATGKWSSQVGQTTSLTHSNPLITHVLVSGERVFVEDLHTDERFHSSWLAEHYGHSGVALPLSSPDRCLGVLWASSDKPWVITNNDISFLESAGNTLAVAIERKETEARMRKLQNDLLQASQFSALGELGSTLAHEVNQPITAIINYIRACQQMIIAGKGQVTQTICELMDKTVTEAERAASIIHHLREFARTGKLHRTLEALNAVVYDASRLALGETTESDIKVNFEFSSQLPLVSIDKIQIQQVVFNLVRNAVEALAETEKKFITIKTISTQNHAVEVQIQDTGPGISSPLNDKIFKRRFSTKNEGMGMGLSISHSIITAHQGDLWVSDTPGGGATFHFTLPLSEIQPTHQETNN
ncbi:ATP-binding protein [Nitrosococcus wardiae]|uniref:histidine kinase n=1 Tax=Nitrosococcus wardiae TaxID=1814290 RepID=A0A4P7BTG9_9GAMM|nr:ATP-binding protein [Nitrosococcus wardiae]QBQ53173.1 response regulator [Nitrosococcus wardiae]